jgi:hypothetical protein
MIIKLLTLFTNRPKITCPTGKATNVYSFRISQITTAEGWNLNRVNIDSTSNRN